MQEAGLVQTSVIITHLVQGFLGVMVAGQVLFYFLFKLGKLLRRILQHAKSQVLEEDTELSAQS